MTSETPPKSKILPVVGWIVSALPIVGLTASAAMKFGKTPEFLESWGKLGYPESLAVPIAAVEIASVLLYAFPMTAVLGAVLLTGYLGGAIATHVRIGEPFLFPAAFGVLVWLGLYLREARLRALLPLR